ncbi:hypothetical protein AAFF_G00054110 [Aldrovandia affinis]|uniref:PLD phosphodiesterase domain-containing protein n=1 Tax=Aldrovandia affinis TaxID=143900 RepID=A0AAD7S164_9TELE|nr:hypothetical protein AAFF_G00054110 [Aldrovandia affinis]
MVRRRSTPLKTPLRRSSRLRNVAVPEYKEESDTDTLEEQPEQGEEFNGQVFATEMSSIPSKPRPETAEASASEPMTNPGYYTVVLKRLKLDEEDSTDGEKEEREKKEDGDKDDPRKAGKQTTSRIPTFQSSSARKRPTGQVAEPIVQPPAKEPLPSHTPADPQRLNPLVIGARPAIRAEAGSHIPCLFSEAAQEVTVQTEIVSRGPTPSKDEQAELEEELIAEEEVLIAEEEVLIAEEEVLIAEEEVRTDSSTQLLPEEKVEAVESGLRSEPEEEEEEQEEENGEEEEEEDGEEEEEEEEEEEQEEEEEAKEENMLPLKEGDGTGENNKGSVFGSELKDKEPSPRESGAGSQSLGGLAGEENMEACVTFGLKEAGFSCKFDTYGGAEEQKSTREDTATGKPLSRRQVLKPDVAKVRLDQPTTPELAVVFSPAESGGGLHLFTTSVDVLVQLELGWLQGLWGAQEPCSSDCSFALVESLPEGLRFRDGSPILPSISNAWVQLLSQANSTVRIAAFYFTLRASDRSALQGEQVFDQLMKLQTRGVKLQIAVNGPQSDPQDTIELNATVPFALTCAPFSSFRCRVREVNLQSVTGGIVHTKLWVVDDKHVYLGSANMDWRSLTQVKEVGVSVGNCSCLARDVARVFEVYWYMGSPEGGFLRPYWPARYSALSSSAHPRRLNLNGVPAHVYLSSAPPQLSGHGRTGDLSAILSVISDAQQFIFISVMDYLPFSRFTKTPRFWPAIDSALRAAACARGVEVNLLVSCWQHSPGSMFIFLESLLALNRHPLSCKIQVKVFEVSSTAEQEKIPFARVNHAKYMVTDRVAYIGTSNWSENYFTQTAGVGLVVNQTGFEVAKGKKTVQSQLQEVFQRDWESEHVKMLSPEHVNRCGTHV